MPPAHASTRDWPCLAASGLTIQTAHVGRVKRLSLMLPFCRVSQCGGEPADCRPCRLERKHLGAGDSDATNAHHSTPPGACGPAPTPCNACRATSGPSPQGQLKRGRHRWRHHRSAGCCSAGAAGRWPPARCVVILALLLASSAGAPHKCCTAQERAISAPPSGSCAAGNGSQAAGLPQQASQTGPCMRSLLLAAAKEQRRGWQ